MNQVIRIYPRKRWSITALLLGAFGLLGLGVNVYIWMPGVFCSDFDRPSRCYQALALTPILLPMWVWWIWKSAKMAFRLRPMITIGPESLSVDDIYRFSLRWDQIRDAEIDYFGTRASKKNWFVRLRLVNEEQFISTVRSQQIWLDRFIMSLSNWDLPPTTIRTNILSWSASSLPKLFVPDCRAPQHPCLEWFLRT